ncbi:hypothetical protein Cgig2_004569 [Carnegiea gigantea]|uniref:GINS subunit domain-containing protein n=1 Tax=Carnegiea gigantea TaxID=171969 RepID=A0A9Q1GQC5_9CARY|nr:hypothetical protein Cgig2_004569 [Carnegiea gigantea]
MSRTQLADQARSRQTLSQRIESSANFDPICEAASGFNFPAKAQSSPPLHFSLSSPPPSFTAVCACLLAWAMAGGSGSGSGLSMEDFESLMKTSDVELLKKAWRNEKAAPEILQFQASLVQRSQEQIQLMEETIEDFTRSGLDPLIVSVYQMDLDRTQYLLRSYLRIRLQKIEQDMTHISQTDLWNRLSEQEQKFAKRHVPSL